MMNAPTGKFVEDPSKYFQLNFESENTAEMTEEELSNHQIAKELE